MQLPEIDFSSLEIKEIGSWPSVLRIGVIALSVIAAIALVYFFIFVGEMSDLSVAEKKLDDKKNEFKDLYTQAVNLDGYKAQMKQMQDAYQDYIKELPSTSNIPELIDSITKVGERNGLKFNFIKIGDAKLEAGFYMTLPLTLNVTGQYHNIGLFISDVSRLARIVTLGDFTIKTASQDNAAGVLEMNIEAQTYWLASASESGQKETDAKQPGNESGKPPAPMEPAAEPANKTQLAVPPRRGK